MSTDNSPPPESTSPSLPNSLGGWLRLWFLMRDPVGRRPYVVSGLGLMVLKYAVEAAVLMPLAGRFYTPLDFVNPVIALRQKFLLGAAEWASVLSIAWVLWTLPFLWIALSMSVRRATDAGKSPWHGLWMLVPGVNLIAMLVLAALPTARQESPVSADQPPRPPQSLSNTVWLTATLGGIMIGGLYATAVIMLSIYLLDSYGLTLFYGTPTVTGAATAYLLNLRERHGYGASMLLAMGAVLLSGVALLLFAAEGAICLLMAVPFMLPLGLLGGLLGKFIADTQRATWRGMVGCLLVLPMLAGVESQVPYGSGDEFVVTSTVDIDAPIDEVWQQVIAFEPIDAPLEWYFRLGIAAPKSASIDGRGVGATRQCHFTTGSFVEPITAWDAPRRLAFDVTEQPEPMFELTPYRDVHPPHLEGAFRSTRGEFRLIKLTDGSTRLVGRTWYRLEIRPHAYWTLWTDWIVHRIHLRVLRHIERLAEDQVKA